MPPIRWKPVTVVELVQETPRAELGRLGTGAGAANSYTLMREQPPGWTRYAGRVALIRSRRAIDVAALSHPDNPLESLAGEATTGTEEQRA